MPPEKLPPLEYLQEELVYNAKTGILKFKSSKYSKTSICNSPQSRGYYRVSLGSFGRFLVHRVIWKLYHKEEPQGQIDHINMIKTDNRIENLRVVCNAINHTNMGQEWPYIVRINKKFRVLSPRCFSSTQREKRVISIPAGYAWLISEYSSCSFTEEQENVLTVIKTKLRDSYEVLPPR
jgi:hypothetical protein